MSKPIFIIVAGVNGAGKSTLYLDNPELFGKIKRLNADEILRQQHGHWQKTADNLNALRRELKDIRTCIAQSQSFHMETTLAGNGKTQRELIEHAHHQEFSVELLYVGVASPQTAINRVQQRLKKGGHGVPREMILKRFDQSLKHLPEIARIVDSVKIYTNDHHFQLIYARQDENTLLDNLNTAPWLPEAKELAPV